MRFQFRDVEAGRGFFEGRNEFLDIGHIGARRAFEGLQCFGRAPSTLQDESAGMREFGSASGVFARVDGVEHFEGAIVGTGASMRFAQAQQQRSVAGGSFETALE
jgi:hypothetical protein